MEPTKKPDFLAFLVERRILSADQATEIRSQVVRSAPQVGKILLERGAMDVRQVMQVVYMQADDRQLFGELAVREGFLSQEDLRLALREQHQMRKHPAEALRETGAIEVNTLFAALVDYLKHLESNSLGP